MAANSHVSENPQLGDYKCINTSFSCSEINFQLEKENDVWLEMWIKENQELYLCIDLKQVYLLEMLLFSMLFETSYSPDLRRHIKVT